MAAEVRSGFEQQDLMERVKSLEKSVQEMQRDQKSREEWSSQQLHSLERQLSLSALTSAATVAPNSPASAMAIRSPRLAYSSSFKRPEVPTTFQMPLHYPRFTQADYEAMPEWQLDRLLEEYGLPVFGTLKEKRQYAIGAFLWGKSGK
ncbi:hypothetical protein KP509_11G083300 [Ceratopteris richardii]|uniref:DUF7722 domain-containing protein n=1 Tax=Ceratopteris richardii TaxID=49495 RepID=A0A8T2TXB3_CERRI|nr:hypothetical protein KP509_11G083300 [Ceratopteris richardii]